MKQFTSEMNDKQGKVYMMLRKELRVTGKSPLESLSSLEQGKGEPKIQDLYDDLTENERLEVAYFHIRKVLRKSVQEE